MYNTYNISNNNPQIYDAYEGFIRGNSFENLYNGYKNHQISNINPKNEQEYDMLMLQIYSFAVNDLDLYLDIHPDDQNVLSTYNQYYQQYQDAQNNYEKKYGSVELSLNSPNTSWMWLNSPWPWEVN